MSYISSDNLNEELKQSIEEIDNLKETVGTLTSNPIGIPVIEPSFDYITQNQNNEFHPNYILVNSYIHYALGNKQIITNGELKVYYSLETSAIGWLEYVGVQYFSPTSLSIRMDSFPVDLVSNIKYIKLELTTNDSVIISRTIPIIKHGVDGKSFTFDDFTSDQLELLQGEKGDIGEQGIRGEKGETGDVNIVHYSSTGATPQKVKLFTGEATVVSDGVWSINYANVGFQQVLAVHATPRYKDTTAGDSPVGAFVLNFTNTTATGKAHKGTSAGLLAAMSSLWATATDTKIQVLVIGY